MMHYKLSSCPLPGVSGAASICIYVYLQYLEFVFVLGVHVEQGGKLTPANKTLFLINFGRQFLQADW